MKSNLMFWQNKNLATEQEFNDFLNHFAKNELISTNKTERETLLDPPEFNDLYFLYKTTRESHAVSILEFGSGYSTLIFAIALYQNYLHFGQEYLKKCTHPNSFQLLTVDASPYFLETSIKRIPEEIQKFVTAHSSQVELFEFGGAGGQIVNRWIDLPNFSPDLIYIDGPDPEQIPTEIKGYKYNNFSLPMSADLLQREFFLWNGTQIIMDGRGANAEFLRRNLKRDWNYFKDAYNDRHIFRLNSEPWGYFANQHSNFKRRLAEQKLPWVDSRETYLKSILKNEQ
jgi:hypothetical protein